jgi:hypothetical protein
MKEYKKVHVLPAYERAILHARFEGQTNGAVATRAKSLTCF